MQNYNTLSTLEEIKAISFFSTSLSTKESIDEILWDITKNVIHRLGLVDCVIYTYDHDKLELTQHAAYGVKNPIDNCIHNKIKLRVGEGIVGSVAISKKAEIIRNTSKDSRYVVDDMSRLSELCLASFWLASKEDGQDGATGPSGPQGEQGVTGADGEQGEQGETGTANVIFSDWITVDYLLDGALESNLQGLEDIHESELNRDTDVVLVYGQRDNGSLADWCDDGADGQNGTDGAQGETGSANVIYSEWLPSEFPNNIPLSQDSFVVEAPDLTMEIVENGLLLVFGRTSNPIDQIIVEQLPRPVFFRDQYYFHRYITTPTNEGPQQFTVEVLSTDGGFIGVPFFEEYRYFIIPGGNPASGKSSIAYSKMRYADKNGEDWFEVTSEAPFSSRFSHTSLVYNNLMWVIGGRNISNSYQNDVWYSANGTDWKIATSNADFSPRSGHTSVVYNNLMWVLGGNENEENKPGDLWLSKDDYYWKVEATDAAGKISQSEIHKFTTRNLNIPKTPLVADGVIDGEGSNNYTNDVWYSEDGLKWTEATPNAEFSKRSFQATVTFNNKLWLIGGLNSELVGDVWSSVDGVTWTEEVAEAPFSYRYYHTATVFNNKIWLIGGNSEGGNALDVWYSENRIDWVMATANISTAKISRPGTVVFKDKLLVFGGSRDSSFNYTNEVWQSEDGVKWNKLAANSSCHHYKARTY
ncbi:Kelch repeat-containing protein 1 [Nymphon striatum]|nr:Kelch repeat-containing protein 1 [Nymphon striatum]